MELLPLMSLAIEPKTRLDRERLKAGLGQLMAEDATIRLQVDEQRDQIIVFATGELHLEIIVDRLKREFDVAASLGRPEVAYKGTFLRTADGEGRFVRQTGVRGHYGHVKIRLTPGGRGTGCVFRNGLARGSIPKEFVAPIDEGIREALSRGAGGYPVDDVVIELYDGSYHEVDSSPMAFRIAASMALQDAATRACPILLEPIMRLEVNVPVEYASDVIADLKMRRAQMQSQTSRGGAQTIRADVPLSETFGYRTDLHARTLGRATYSMTFDRYERRPGDAGGDDRAAPVGAPRKPAPKLRNSTVSLPEPDRSDL